VLFAGTGDGKAEVRVIVWQDLRSFLTPWDDDRKRVQQFLVLWSDLAEIVFTPGSICADFEANNRK
jgi:hypothetical protein